LALALLAVTLLVVPGARRLATEGEKHHWAIGDSTFKPFPVAQRGMSSFGIPVWSHGWPFEYGARTQNETKSQSSAASNASHSWPAGDAWRLTNEVYQFNFWYLVADIVIGVAIVSLLVAGCERWRRRRGRLRFSLFDVAVVATLVCCLLGWRQWHLHEQQLETNVVNA